jgi:hypothetical protein
VAELVDARDLKSRVQQWTCGFDSRLRHSILFRSPDFAATSRKRLDSDILFKLPAMIESKDLSGGDEKEKRFSNYRLTSVIEQPLKKQAAVVLSRLYNARYLILAATHIEQPVAIFLSHLAHLTYELSLIAALFVVQKRDLAEAEHPFLVYKPMEDDEKMLF